MTAILGPTNTGKTHYAIERMLAHPTGIIGLPLRLLAREVYGRLVERVGPAAVALITGEEKIKPKQPRFWVATVEAMPRDLDVSFVALDEVQLAATLDRGHVFTDRLLNRRGRDETLVIGATTMRRAVEQLLPGAAIASRPRLSTLSFAGEKKLSRLPARTAIVAFSAEEVYAIAELIRRQRGGAAVVLGALSPRTRNAQVAMYQNGDVDYLVATDAIGMGLNLDLDHVAFAGDRKFDGHQYRRLTPAEMGQIAGRAGRHLRDGTFGTTGRCAPFDADLVEALEDHAFDQIPVLQWRNSDLDVSTIEDLQASLERVPTEPGLTRAPLAEDVMVLGIAARDAQVRRAAKTRADVARLWDVCQIPDYRKVSPSAHADLALTLFGFVVRANHIPDVWFGTQQAALDRIDGDIDALSSRIAQVRTLTYIANRPDWLRDPEHWQGVTRQLEDRLSDALHERLAQRFVDRRTSVLMRRLRENATMEAEITGDGDVMVEGQHVGQLHGFRFTPDPLAAGEAARALNAAASKALGGEIESRAERFSASVDESLALANDGAIRWLGDPVAKLAAGDKLLAPRARVIADEHLAGPALETVQRRLDLWLAQHVRKHLGPLMEFEEGTGLEGIARGIGFQVAEALGVLERSRVAEELKGLDQGARGALRKAGLRFGAYHLYMPALIKPAPRALASQLWTLRHGANEAAKGFDEVPHLAASGRTSFPADPHVPKGLYRAAGFRVCGTRAVRVDILERLADLIRPAIAYRPGTTAGTPPPGTADNDGFVQTVHMTSLVGCSGEDFASILRSLGYVLDRRAGPAITVPLVAPAPVVPLTPILPEPAPSPSDPGPDGSGPSVATAPAPAPGGHFAEFDLDRLETGSWSPAPVIATADASPTRLEPVTTSDIGGAPDVPPAVEAADRSVAFPAGDGTVADAVSRDTGSVTTSDIGEAPEIPPVAEAAATRDAGAIEEPSAATSEVGAQPGPAAEAVSTEGDTAVGGSETPVAADDAAEGGVADGGAAAAHLDEAVEMSGAAEALAEPAPVDPHASDPAMEAAPTASAGVDPEPSAEAEAPALIDVWRPHRAHHHAARRPERSNQRPARTRFAAPAAATEGDVPPAQPQPAEAGDDHRGPFPARERHRERRPGAGEGRGPGGGFSRNRNRPESGTVAPDGRQAPGGAEGGARFEGRRERRNDRPEGGRGEDAGRSQHFSSERPAPRERQPDPNSPFAKLMALKLELERKKEP